MKWVRRILLVVVILVIAVIVAVSFYLGPIIKGAVEKVGPEIAKVPMELERARVSPLRGTAKLQGLVIGNPEGFKTPHSVKLAAFSMNMSIPSVFTDKILIREILIDGPDIVYEMSLSGSNIAKIQENAAGGKEAEPREEEPAEEKADEGGKKVQIDNLIIKNGKIRVSSGVMLGKAVVIPLPTIHLKDIGKEKEGASAAEVFSEVFGAVANGVVGAVTASGKLIGDGAKALGAAGMKGAEMGADALGKGAEATAELAGKGAGAAVEGVKATGDVAAKGAGAAVDGAKATGKLVGKGAGAAADGAKATGKMVGKGASKVVGGVGKLFGGKKEKEEEKTE